MTAILSILSLILAYKVGMKILWVLIDSLKTVDYSKELRKRRQNPEDVRMIDLLTLAYFGVKLIDDYKRRQ